MPTSQCIMLPFGNKLVFPESQSHTLNITLNIPAYKNVGILAESYRNGI
jgi:hypothetical protein